MQNKGIETNYSDKIRESATFLEGFLGNKPDIGIILGTGLGGLLSDIEILKEIPYVEIPNFPTSTVTSHKGKLILGRFGGKLVLAMEGRFHYYEGYTMKEVTFPIRVMKRIGVRYLFVSNASGGLNPEFNIGDVMVLEDHIDLFPENPLRGKHEQAFGDRFPDMSEAYSKEMISRAFQVDHKTHSTLRRGVYAGVQGPNLETPAEYRYLRTIGADAVGMSTIPEVIVAVQSGMKIFALSAITDLCTPGNIKKITLSDILQAAAKAEPLMRKIILELVKKI